MNQKNTTRLPGCPVSGRCGGCIYSGILYQEQLQKKQEVLTGLLGSFGEVLPILPMEEHGLVRLKI